MAEQKAKKYKAWKWVVLAVAVLILGFGVFVVVDNLLYTKQTMGRESNLVAFDSPDGDQQIYILGTIHSSHYERKYGYSVADVRNVIDNVKPDLVLVEVRQDTVKQYGVLDGPSEMILGWCRAQELGIPAEGIDWWKIEPGSRSNSTTEERDDRMYENILTASASHSRVLVLCGATHRVNQSKRLLENGYRSAELADVASYFEGVSEQDFVYPVGMREELEKKIKFCAEGFPAEIKAGLPEGEERDTWMKQAQDLANSLQDTVDRFVVPNRIYAD